MPSEFQFFIDNPFSGDYEGPYQTRDQAISHAVLNGWFEKVEDDHEIEVSVCEGRYPLISDVEIAGEDILDNVLEGTIWELDKTNITDDHMIELSQVMSSAFQMWAKDHNVKFAALLDTRNSEIVTLPEPDHAKKLQEE